MIITLIVLAYLAWQAWRGYRTGFTRYIINLIFSAIVFVVAIIMQNPFGNWLYAQFTGHQIATNFTTHTDLMLFRFLAFFIILFLGRIIVHLFKSWIPKKNSHGTNLGSIIDGVLGSLASLIAGYFFIYVILSMLNALQNPWFMQQTINSSLLRFIIYDTPGLSNGLFNNIFNIARTAA